DDRILLEEPVISIDLEARVARTPRREISYDTLISSMPFDRLLRMTGLEHDPSVFSYNKVLVFNLGFDRKGPEGVNWIYYPSRDLCFYRVGFYDNIFGADRMSNYVEIGYPADAVVDAEETHRMRELVLTDLKRCGLVDDHQLVASHSVVLDPAYVHINQASISAVAAQKRVLESHGVYSAGRYGSWTYCSIEDNMVEARALAERLGGGPPS
ncbi:MAG: LPS biosynthesis protein, partial [Myxococcota bacterium]|nr:LPS biosynthesis protein [Myxococcota bacterium]